MRLDTLSFAAVGLVAACTTVETSSSTSSSGAGGGTSSSSTSSSSSTGMCPPPDCGTCTETADNSALDVASLRMAQLSISAPPVLASGTVATVIAGALNPKIPACGSPAGGTFNWLLELTLSTSLLKTGGALPVPDIKQGYTFFEGDLAGVPVAPKTTPFILDPSGALTTTDPIDLLIPMFLDDMGAQFVLLPLRELQLSAQLSADHNCIGEYDLSLEPGGCFPDNTHPLFVNAGSLDAHINLEDADTIDVSTLSQSLCVLLSGDPSMYGDAGSPIERCARDSMGQILFEGDWCSATNAPATIDCRDAMKLSASFAAAAVKINN